MKKWPLWPVPSVFGCSLSSVSLWSASPQLWLVESGLCGTDRPFRDRWCLPLPNSFPLNTLLQPVAWANRVRRLADLHSRFGSGQFLVKLLTPFDGLNNFKKCII